MHARIKFSTERACRDLFVRVMRMKEEEAGGGGGSDKKLPIKFLIGSFNGVITG